MNSKEAFRESFSWRTCQSNKSPGSIKIQLSVSGRRNRLESSGSIFRFFFSISEINTLPDRFSLGLYLICHIFPRTYSFWNIDREWLENDLKFEKRCTTRKRSDVALPKLDNPTVIQQTTLVYLFSLTYRLSS